MDAITAMQNQLNYLQASLESEGRNPLVSGSKGSEAGSSQGKGVQGRAGRQVG